MTTAKQDAGRIAFLGAGKMATALAAGFLRGGLVAPDAIVAADPHPASREAFAARTSARATESNLSAIDGADIVFLAVKPQMMSTVLQEISAQIHPRQLVVSIAAGVPLSRLQGGLASGIRVIRVMPNTPCLVSEGASAYSLGDAASAADGELVERLLSTSGRVHRVPESLLDAVTGLSGSGPAFAYQVIEALSDGGVRMGLPRALATELAAQTLLGAARMVLDTGKHPGELKDEVTSPGGTTIAGLHALEAGGLRAALIDAVVAATTRSLELGRGA